jgi:hypothetical protein
MYLMPGNLSWVKAKAHEQAALGQANKKGNTH